VNRTNLPLARSVAAEGKGEGSVFSTDAAILILAGGRGTRFWPESRLDRPKPLFSIDGKTSLLADTVARMRPLIGQDRVFVLASADQASLFRPTLRRLIPPRNLIVEPEGRGTAVAIAYGTAIIARRFGGQTVVGVMPADHYVTPGAAFRRTLRDAIGLASNHPAIVVIGIKPTRLETGYGYVKTGAPVPVPKTQIDKRDKQHGRQERDTDNPTWVHSRSSLLSPLSSSRGAAFKLDRFVEKPPAATALKMIRSGKYLWNAGMFVMSAATLAAELERHATRLAVAMRSFASMGPAELEHSYRALEFDAFDRVIAEKSRNVLGVRARFQWHDVGSWEGLWEALRGRRRNVLSGNILALEADGVLARARDRLMVLLGVKDIVAIDTGDVILIAHRSQSQDVRKVIDQLKRRGLERYL
jgi:mannose-1-phosphate guanylyltransferase